MHLRNGLVALKKYCLPLFLMAFVVSIAGCDKTAGTIERPNYTKLTPSSTPSNQPDLTALYESEVAAAQNNQQSHVVVTCTLPVKRMLRPDEKGEKHEKFLLQVSNGTTILVAHNTSRAPSVPLSAGDIVTVHGEYIWNAKGGVIHWTHRSDTPRHEGGYIDFKGQRYQ